MRPNVAVFPPARLLPCEDRTPYRPPPSLAPLVGGGRGPEGRHLNQRVIPRPRRVKDRAVRAVARRVPRRAHVILEEDPPRAVHRPQHPSHQPHNGVVESSTM
eukprot:7689767-Pyramimonas_sp.AAC.1